uniref:Acyltransferase 3 domain-containing protein n=1 Tax=Anopheles farauti TaxID=69004 RepID=A0A182QKT8_9DIPT
MDQAVVFLLVVLSVHVQCYDGPKDENRMPPIYMYDSFERCESLSSVYCYARTVLREDQLPAGFVMPPIESTDRIVHNHRPNFLELGVCLEQCERELASFSASSRRKLFQPKIPVNFTFQIPNALFPTLVADKRRYETLVNVCVNRRLSSAYNMTGYTELEYCRANSQQAATRPFDALEILFLVLLAVLVGTLILSTFADICGIKRDNALVSSFAIHRNWQRLMAEESSRLHRDLLYIDGLRVVINHLVIILHTFLIMSAVPSKNYAEIENLAGKAPTLIYLSSNAFLVQTFFTIGGYLLSVNFLRDTTRVPINFRYVGNKLLNRLLRLLPVYGFFLLFSVSVNTRFDVNMNGYRLFTVENAICRQNWWTNLFFVNNFMWPAELCLMHTWYLAADMQLFVMALVLLLLVHRWPKSIGVVFLLGVVVSFTIPGYIMHQHKLHPVLPAKQSEAKFIFMYEPWLRRLYLPSYANTGCYLYGIIAGYLYHWVTNNKLQLHRSLLYRTIDRCVTPTLVSLILSTFVWYTVDIPKPSLWVSAYSALYRNIIGIFVAVCFLRSINSPLGIVRKILSSKLLTTLGKLTYSVYVLHDVVMRLVLLNERYGSSVSVQKVVLFVYQVTAVSYAAGLVVFLAIEQPMIMLLKPHINRLCPVGVKTKNH